MFQTNPLHRKVVMRLSEPRRRPSGEWACLVQIADLEKPEITEAFGEDSLQALLLGAAMAKARLESLQPAHGLTWMKEGDLGLSL